MSRRENDNQDTLKFELYRSMLNSHDDDNDVKLAVILMLLSMDEIELWEAIGLCIESGILSSNLKDVDEKANELGKKILSDIKEMTKNLNEVAK